MSEPRPPLGDDVSDRILDELRLVFAPSRPETDEPQPDQPQPDQPQPDEPASVEPASVEPAPVEPASVESVPAVQTPVADGSGTSEPARPPRATIVIGGDDSLPDPVYLDDSDLAPLSQLSGNDSSGRGTIIIGNELDSTGAFDAVAVPSRSMDPRVRARRVAVKRARGRKRLVWAGAIALVLLIGVAVLAVFSSSLFAVEHIDLQGASYTQFAAGEQLQSILDDLNGQPVLLLDTLEYERRLEEIPWIERAFVTTDFPNRVLIDVRERRPLATFQGSDGHYRVIDRDGRVLSLLTGRPIDYMLLTGPAPDTEPGGLAGAPFASAAQMVSALPGEIRALTITASVDATTGELGLMLLRPAPAAGSDADGEADAESLSDPDDPESRIEVRIGSPTNLDGKLARLLQLVRDGLDDVVRIDVSTDEASVTKR